MLVLPSMAFVPLLIGIGIGLWCRANEVRGLNGQIDRLTATVDQRDKEIALRSQREDRITRGFLHRLDVQVADEGAPPRTLDRSKKNIAAILEAKRKQKAANEAEWERANRDIHG